MKFTPNEINNAFISGVPAEIPNNADPSHIYPTPADANEDKFYFKNITPLEVKIAISQVTSYSVGVDGISIRMIKLIIDVLLLPLCHLYNYSLQFSCYPNIWKKALVKALPKITCPKLTTDYRPINLLCVLSKILEKIVFNQIMEFINSKNILDPLQSGFRKVHSTGTALLKIVEDIKIAKSEGFVTILVLLDYSKAFDCVLHHVLLIIMRHLRFSEPVINWSNNSPGY